MTEFLIPDVIDTLASSQCIPMKLVFKITIAIAFCASFLCHPGTSYSQTLEGYFKNAASAKIYSYYNSGIIEVVADYPDSAHVVKPQKDTSNFIVRDLRILQSDIKEVITLSMEQRSQLLKLFSARRCRNGSIAMCYVPRHAIVFFNSDDKPVGYIELCLECANRRTSDKMQVDFCFENAKMVKKVFQSFGVTYFGEVYEAPRKSEYQEAEVVEEKN